MLGRSLFQRFSAHIFPWPPNMFSLYIENPRCLDSLARYRIVGACVHANSTTQREILVLPGQQPVSAAVANGNLEISWVSILIGMCLAWQHLLLWQWYGIAAVFPVIISYQDWVIPCNYLLLWLGCSLHLSCTMIGCIMRTLYEC